jgi:hypothetical protein
MDWIWLGANMIVKAFDITYDIDLENIREVNAARSLPHEIMFEVEDDFEPEDDLADLVSEKTGFAVITLNYETY